MLRIRVEYTLFWILIFKLSPLAPADITDQWVIWNIGQGQWVTHVTTETCRHYDVGGEIGRFAAIRKKLLTLCLHRENQIALSHWDFDHYAHIPALVKSVPHVCWLSQPPVSEEKSTMRQILQLGIKPCDDQNFFHVQRQTEMWRPTFSKTSNESSGVFQDGSFLLPGDSPISQEKKWIRQMTNLDEVRFLVLGHHGSRSSTGDELLWRLKNLKMTLASARFAKYHHPHFLTVQRIKNRQVPLLRTEDWGNIFL